MIRAVGHWLLKSEPSAFSIDALRKERTSSWDGVRNYQARNYLRQMKVGERAFFYHSNADPSGIVGVCAVVREAYPDHTAWDPKGKYYDPKSTPERPIWWMPDVGFLEKFPRMIALAELRETPGLEGMVLLRRGSRLSVQPVTEEEWRIIESIAQPSTRATPRIP